MDAIRQVLQRSGVAIGILWTAIVAVCSLALIAVFVASYELWAALTASGVIGVLAIVLVATGWFIVRLWVWIFE